MSLFPHARIYARAEAFSRLLQQALCEILRAGRGSSEATRLVLAGVSRVFGKFLDKNA
jgi:hypothetical protein